MSNQEAIALLRNLEDSLDSYCELSEEGKTAFRMAIEALSSSEIPNSSDTISRKAAIKEVSRDITVKGWKDAERVAELMKIFADRIKQLPPAQPAIVPCDYAKACNEVAMNRITSAVVYMEILEDFKEYGYVLVDMREVTE